MKRFTLILCGIVLVFLASFSLAEIPKMINYQGMLTDDSGDPITDTLDLQFRIYNAQTSGTLKWIETHCEVPIIDGLFNVILGSVNPIDTLSFSENYWLEVQVGLDTMPRIQFTSVGYAYRALKADTANYALVAPGSGGNLWMFRITDTADTTITTSGRWGIARYGNVLFGNVDSTHVNLGVACTTGTSGYNYGYCTVGGGYQNSASSNATVGGRTRNSARGGTSTVGGGFVNTASGGEATVGGGSGNTASGYSSTVGGGHGNTAGGGTATVGGGENNDADSGYATIGGGYDNTAYTRATVGGGQSNIASGQKATVAGGWVNTAGNYYATVGGGGINTASGEKATVGGGWTNAASGSFATVGGGERDTASSTYATVGGGYGNIASDLRTTIGGGYDNTASDFDATVGGGYGNTASGFRSTISGGWDNTAAGGSSVIGGGEHNANSGGYSVIPGGLNDTLTASGDYSIVFGQGVYINNSYRVAFFDGVNSGRLGINRDDREGGISYPVHVGTNSGNGNAAYLTGGGVWTDISSRLKKEDFQEFDGAQVLNKIENIPVTLWKFKGTEERHISPVAEDFYRAFGCGTGIPEDDSTSIAAMDLAGVSLVAIQELNRIIKEQQREIELLKAKIEALETGVR